MVLMRSPAGAQAGMTVFAVQAQSMAAHKNKGIRLFIILV